MARILSPVTATIVLAYFLFFTWRGLSFYFDSDDMMNLYLAWNKPWREVLEANLFFWSSFYRPMGALFYRTVFALAGFHPLPFRMVCLGIGLLNIALCFWFAKLVSASERVGALAILLFAFHPRLLEVWYRTSVVYDLLCFTFFYAAACLYIDGRRGDDVPRGWRAAAILVCYVGALDTKEMAVSLPVILLTWELLFERARTIRWPWKKLWLIGVMAAANLPYFYGKTHTGSALANNPFYRPEYSWNSFTHSWALYLDYIFMRELTWFSPTGAMAVLTGLLAIAVVFRSRRLLLAWTIMVVGLLPVSFIPARGGFVLYISWAGWVLYAAVVLVALEDLFAKQWPRGRTAVACGVFVLVGWRFGKMNLHDQRTDPRPWLYHSPNMVRTMFTQMHALHPVLPRGVKMLFLDDAFGNGEWTPYFIMKLGWHDDSMIVDRVTMMGRKPDNNADYNFVFDYQNGLYKQIKP